MNWSYKDWRETKRRAATKEDVERIIIHLRYNMEREQRKKIKNATPIARGINVSKEEITRLPGGFIFVPSSAEDKYSFDSLENNGTTNLMVTNTGIDEKRSWEFATKEGRYLLELAGFRASIYLLEGQASETERIPEKFKNEIERSPLENGTTKLSGLIIEKNGEIVSICADSGGDKAYATIDYQCRYNSELIWINDAWHKLVIAYDDVKAGWQAILLGTNQQNGYKAAYNVETHEYEDAPVHFCEYGIYVLTSMKNGDRQLHVMEGKTELLQAKTHNKERYELKTSKELSIELTTDEYGGYLLEIDGDEIDEVAGIGGVNFPGADQTITVEEKSEAIAAQQTILLEKIGNETAVSHKGEEVAIVKYLYNSARIKTISLKLPCESPWAFERAGVRDGNNRELELLLGLPTAAILTKRDGRRIELIITRETDEKAKIEINESEQGKSVVPPTIYPDENKRSKTKKGVVLETSVGSMTDISDEYCLRYYGIELLGEETGNGVQKFTLKAKIDGSNRVVFGLNDEPAEINYPTHINPEKNWRFCYEKGDSWIDAELIFKRNAAGQIVAQVRNYYYPQKIDEGTQSPVMFGWIIAKATRGNGKRAYELVPQKAEMELRIFDSSGNRINGMVEIADGQSKEFQISYKDKNGTRKVHEIKLLLINNGDEGSLVEIHKREGNCSKPKENSVVITKPEETVETTETQLIEGLTIEVALLEEMEIEIWQDNEGGIFAREKTNEGQKVDLEIAKEIAVKTSKGTVLIDRRENKLTIKLIAEEGDDGQKNSWTDDELEKGRIKTVTLFDGKKANRIIITARKSIEYEDRIEIGIGKITAVIYKGGKLKVVDADNIFYIEYTDKGLDIRAKVAGEIENELAEKIRKNAEEIQGYLLNTTYVTEKSEPTAQARIQVKTSDAPNNSSTRTYTIVEVLSAIEIYTYARWWDEERQWQEQEIGTIFGVPEELKAAVEKLCARIGAKGNKEVVFDASLEEARTLNGGEYRNRYLPKLGWTDTAKVGKQLTAFENERELEKALLNLTDGIWATPELVLDNASELMSGHITSANLNQIKKQKSVIVKLNGENENAYCLDLMPGIYFEPDTWRTILALKDGKTTQVRQFLGKEHDRSLSGQSYDFVREGNLIHIYKARNETNWHSVSDDAKAEESKEFRRLSQMFENTLKTQARLTGKIPAEIILELGAKTAEKCLEGMTENHKGYYNEINLAKQIALRNPQTKIPLELMLARALGEETGIKTDDALKIIISGETEDSITKKRNARMLVPEAAFEETFGNHLEGIGLAPYEKEMNGIFERMKKNLFELVIECPQAMIPTLESQVNGIKVMFGAVMKLEDGETAVPLYVYNEAGNPNYILAYRDGDNWYRYAGRNSEWTPMGVYDGGWKRDENGKLIEYEQKNGQQNQRFVAEIDKQLNGLLKNENTHLAVRRKLADLGLDSSKEDGETTNAILFTIEARMRNRKLAGGISNICHYKGTENRFLIPLGVMHSREERETTDAIKHAKEIKRKFASMMREALRTRRKGRTDRTSSEFNGDTEISRTARGIKTEYDSMVEKCGRMGKNAFAMLMTPNRTEIELRQAQTLVEYYEKYRDAIICRPGRIILNDGGQQVPQRIGREDVIPGATDDLLVLHALANAFAVRIEPLAQEITENTRIMEAMQLPVRVGLIDLASAVISNKSDRERFEELDVPEKQLIAEVINRGKSSENPIHASDITPKQVEEFKLMNPAAVGFLIENIIAKRMISNDHTEAWEIGFGGTSNAAERLCAICNIPGPSEEERRALVKEIVANPDAMGLSPVQKEFIEKMVRKNGDDEILLNAVEDIRSIITRFRKKQEIRPATELARDIYDAKYGGNGVLSAQEIRKIVNGINGSQVNAWTFSYSLRGIAMEDRELQNLISLLKRKNRKRNSYTINKRTRIGQNMALFSATIKKPPKTENLNETVLDIDLIARGHGTGTDAMEANKMAIEALRIAAVAGWLESVEDIGYIMTVIELAMVAANKNTKKLTGLSFAATVHQRWTDKLDTITCGECNVGIKYPTNVTLVTGAVPIGEMTWEAPAAGSANSKFEINTDCWYDGNGTAFRIKPELPVKANVVLSVRYAGTHSSDNNYVEFEYE